VPRRLVPAAHLTGAELDARYRAARDPVARTRWQVIRLVARGRACAEAAEIVGYSVDWVRIVIRRYNAAGPEAVADGRRTNPGGATLLSTAQQAELRVALGGPAPDGGLWTGPKVAAWIGQRIGRPVGAQRGWEYLRRLGFTLQRPRPREVRADLAAQTTFQKGGSPASSSGSVPPIPLHD
jgi:transposase